MSRVITVPVVHSVESSTVPENVPVPVQSVSEENDVPMDETENIPSLAHTQFPDNNDRKRVKYDDTVESEVSPSTSCRVDLPKNQPTSMEVEEPEVIEVRFMSDTEL